MKIYRLQNHLTKDINFPLDGVKLTSFNISL